MGDSRAYSDPELGSHWRADVVHALSDWRQHCLRQDLEVKKFLRRLLPLNEADSKRCGAVAHRIQVSVHLYPVSNLE